MVDYDIHLKICFTQKKRELFIQQLAMNAVRQASYEALAMCKTLVRKRTFTSTNQFYLANSSSLLVPQHECFFARRKSIKPRATEASKRCLRDVVLIMRLKPRQTSALLVPNLPTGRVNARSTALIGSVIDDNGDAVDNVG